MDSQNDADCDFGSSECSSADGLPHDFIAYEVLWMCPRRFVRKGVDDWDVLRWSDRWTIFDNYGDTQVANEYNRADQVFVRQQKVRIPMNHPG